ncbi:YheV family putative zinc ribbon protein [Marinobacter sp. VGCF2001]|uniref:YheV family putative zinc ribbon protein n=1 Tax=Marinobacter sp. VGCF2001 TaxID=3417189 RepID=UPI003CF93D88
MASPKRFIAGAVCPRCAEMDKIMMFTDDNGEQVRECVACGFTDAMSDQPPPSAPEIETRVNKRENTDDHTVKQVVFFKSGADPESED